MVSAEFRYAEARVKKKTATTIAQKGELCCAVFLFLDSQLNVNNMCKHIFRRGQGEIMPVKEARKLLGAVSADYSDTDLAQVVRSMTTLSELLLDCFTVPQNQNVCYN